MPPRRHDAPTDREAEILAILWEKGETDVEGIRAGLTDRPTANTVRTLLGIMLERGLVADDGRAYGRKYRALVPRAQIQCSALRRLVDTLFAGSAAEVVLRLVDEGEVDAEQLQKLQKRLKDKN